MNAAHTALGATSLAVTTTAVGAFTKTLYETGNPSATAMPTLGMMGTGVGMALIGKFGAAVGGPAWLSMLFPAGVGMAAGALTGSVVGAQLVQPPR